MRRGGHICATDLMLWCANNEPPAPAPGKDDFHMETVCTLVNIIGNAARSSVKVRACQTGGRALCLHGCFLLHAYFRCFDCPVSMQQVSLFSFSDLSPRWAMLSR